MTPFLSRVSALARMATQRSDIVVVIIMVLAVAMMVIPLPTLMIDVLIAVNMTFSMIVLAVAFYIGRPGDFSSLPPIILLATLFRLALSISTTRLILVQADAGEIVNAFGEFVIGGQLVVGLVVFMIIAAAQFIVITKGAERVAEVAARFTLDAMPGKQMAIDNDLRNGDIDQAEARFRRGNLDRESQLYGAMDGAMKFVKGDAITGLIIIFVNLIGGLIIGMINHGMSFSQASATYGLLTVGDGLIAQIPALLISLAAGLVVTRITTDSQTNLGHEIARQLSAVEQPLFLAMAALFGAAMIPGFPTGVFLVLAIIVGCAAVFVRRRNRRSVADTTTDTQIETAPVVAPEMSMDEGTISSDGSTRYRLVITIGSALAQAISPQRFKQDANELRAGLSADIGISFPAVELRHDANLTPDGFQISLEDVPVRDGEIPAQMLLLDDDPMHLDLLQIPTRSGPQPLGKSAAMDGGVWLDREHAPVLEHAGIACLDPHDILTRSLSEILRRYAAQFVGIQETRELLTGLEGDYGELLREIGQTLPLNKLADILRRLVEEDVPVTNLRAILESLIEWAPRDGDTSLLTERVRGALARQISHRHAQMNRVIAAYVMTPPAETALRSALKIGNGSVSIVLPEEQSHILTAQIRHAQQVANASVSPVIIISIELRRPMRNYLMRNGIDIPVLSYPEIAPEYSVQSLMSVSLTSQNRNQNETKVSPNESGPYHGKSTPADARVANI